MYKFLAITLTFCLFQDTIAYCCFRDACVLPTCGCPDTDTSGIFTCNACSNNPVCNCGASAPCFRDTSNVCFVCDKPSPVCSCLKSINGGCGNPCDYSTRVGCGCGNDKSFIYFPEVEYPAVALEMKPFYYGSCLYA